MGDSDLQKRLEQLGNRLVEDVETWERTTRDKRRAVVSRIASEVESALTQHQSRAERRALQREERAARKQARRREEAENASVAGGVVMLLIAAGLGVYAFLEPQLWWMIFAALGPGMGGARMLSLALARDRREASVAPKLPSAPVAIAPAHEVDVLCDQLLADLAQAPEAVKTFVQKPEATIQALRSAARALDARRLQLQAEAPAERVAALSVQRQALAERQAAATDELARLKLAEAVASVDSQRAALEQLARAAERVDGEYTSLLVSLQELRTRVSIARTAGTSVQLEGLKASVQRLNGELEAISDGLDSVARERLQPVASVEAPAPPVGGLTRAGERDR